MITDLLNINVAMNCYDMHKLYMLLLITLWAVITLFWIQCLNFNLKIEAIFIKYCMRKGEWGITVSEVTL